MIKDYINFSDQKEQLEFMKKYGLASKTMSHIPKLYYRIDKECTYKTCTLLGYVKEYETWCEMVIDYGNGPLSIHSDYFIDMQKIERKKGASLKEYTDTLVVFDFETTGTNPRECEIIQIGAIKYVNGIETATFNEYIRPNNSIPAKITALTGITDLDVCMADGIDIVLKKFLDFIGNNILMGYNISSFDTTLLYDHAKQLYNIDVTNDYIDLRYIATAYFKEHNINIPNHKLTTIASYFGIDTENAHRALDDCYITYMCYNEIFGKQTQTAPEEPITINNITINNITNKLEQNIFDMLQEVISSEELPDSCLYLASNISRKGKNQGMEITKSICVHEPDYPLGSNTNSKIGKNDTFAQLIYTTDHKVRIRTKDRYLRDLAIPSNTKVVKKKSDGWFSNIDFQPEAENICDFVRSVVLIGLQKYESSSSFGCCSQFTRCSDLKKCVHENKLYSKGCMYRKNLEAGRIFYGKNRNIDS